MFKMQNINSCLVEPIQVTLVKMALLVKRLSVYEEWKEEIKVNG